MLTARYKRSVFDREHILMRALCGCLNCRGEFGTFLIARMHSDGTAVWAAFLDAGYVERQNGHWELGTHAARSRRHEPRHPRRASWPTAFQQAIKRTRSGSLIVYAPAGYVPEGAFISPLPDTYESALLGQKRSSKQTAFPFFASSPYVFRCARCGAESVVCLHELGCAKPIVRLDELYEKGDYQLFQEILTKYS